MPPIPFASLKILIILTFCYSYLRHLNNFCYLCTRFLTVVIGNEYEQGKEIQQGAS